VNDERRYVHRDGGVGAGIPPRLGDIAGPRVPSLLLHLCQIFSAFCRNNEQPKFCSRCFNVQRRFKHICTSTDAFGREEASRPLSPNVGSAQALNKARASEKVPGGVPSAMALVAHARTSWRDIREDFSRYITVCFSLISLSRIPIVWYSRYISPQHQIECESLGAIQDG